MFIPLNKRYRSGRQQAICLDKYLANCLSYCSSENVFRGQSDASWLLTPSGFRNEKNKLLSLTDRQERLNTFQDDKFIDSCMELRELIEEKEEIKNLKKSEYNRFQLFVIAQHFGIPTPLLDWTQSPLIAAFMATNFSKKACDIAIYKMDTSITPENLIYEDYQSVSFRRIQSQLGGVSCFGRISNENLQLMPNTIEEYLETNKQARNEECFISKVIVSVTENDIGKIRDILKSNGIDAGTMFPSSGYWKAQSIKHSLDFF